MIQQTVFPRSEWAKEVKKMCNYTCAHCGKRSETKEMHAHHIVPRSESDDLACVLENGVALCSTCHRILHFGGDGGISESVKEIAERSTIISLPKGQKANIEAAAAAAGESINGYVNRLIRTDLGLSEDEWKGEEKKED